MFKRNSHGFTLVEIVVSATILVILTSIGFYSYTKNISDARDSKRKSDIATLKSQLSLYQKQRGSFPIPGDTYQILNRGYTVAYQGYMNQKVALNTSDQLLLDPELEIPYIYSISRTKQEYQLALSLENSDSPIAILDGNYKSVAKNILPNIILAKTSTTAVEINNAIGTGSTNRNLFIFNNGFHNIPYDFVNGSPQTDGITFSGALSDAGNDYWQNSDYRNCSEIFNAAKGITPSGQTDEYQILSSSGTLTNTGCLAP